MPQHQEMTVRFILQRGDTARTFIVMYRMEWWQRLLHVAGVWIAVLLIVFALRYMDGVGLRETWERLFHTVLAHDFLSVLLKIIILAGSVLVIFREYAIGFFAFLFTPNPYVGQEVRMYFTEEGLHSEVSGFKSFCPWRNVQRLVRTKTHLFLFLSPRLALILPLRAFDNSVRQSAVMDMIVRYGAHPSI